MDDYIGKQYQAYLDQMPDSPRKTYIVERIIDQIRWYDSSSVNKQKRFKQFTILAIALNASIPAVVFLGNSWSVMKLFVVILSSASGAISAIVALCGYKDLWVQYRSNCELLKSMLHCFFQRSGDFKDASNEDDLYDILVMKSEQYLTREFRAWEVVVNDHAKPSQQDK